MARPKFSIYAVHHINAPANTYGDRRIARQRVVQQGGLDVFVALQDRFLVGDTSNVRKVCDNGKQTKNQTLVHQRTRGRMSESAIRHTRIQQQQEFHANVITDIELEFDQFALQFVEVFG